MKSLTKRNTLSALFAGLALALGGCSKQAEVSSADEGPAAGTAAATVKRIAVIPKGTTHPFWKSVEAGAQHAGADNGFEIIWKGALVESDRAQQIQIIKQFVTQKVDGIVLAPLDAKAPGIISAVKDATAAGIPVVIMDSSLNAVAGQDYITFAATSNKGRTSNETRKATWLHVN